MTELREVSVEVQVPSVHDEVAYEVLDEVWEVELREFPDDGVAESSILRVSMEVESPSDHSFEPTRRAVDAIEAVLATRFIGVHDALPLGFGEPSDTSEPRRLSEFARDGDD